MELIVLFIYAALVNNLILMRVLGVCPFLGVSRKIESAFGMGLALVFVTTVSVAFCWMTFHFILVPQGIEYLDLIAFILIVTALVQGTEIFVKKASPTLHSALGMYLPITTICAVVAVIYIMNRSGGESFAIAIIHALGASVGFTLVSVIFAGIRERLERNDISEAFKGFPIGIIAAGLMSLAF